MRILPLLASVLLLVPLTPRPASARGPASPLPVDTGCVGCEGTGGTATASGGSCGGTVTIAVVMIDGACKWTLGGEPGELFCQQITGCLPEITRSWSGLPSNSVLDFCVELEGQELCLNPKPMAGPSGSGSSTRNSARQDCSNDAGNTRLYSVQSDACGLMAAAESRCSACDSF
jgi:hypothetical protein